MIENQIPEVMDDRRMQLLLRLKTAISEVLCQAQCIDKSDVYHRDWVTNFDSFVKIKKIILSSTYGHGIDMLEMRKRVFIHVAGRKYNAPGFNLEMSRYELEKFVIGAVIDWGKRNIHKVWEIPKHWEDDYVISNNNARPGVSENG